MTPLGEEYREFVGLPGVTRAMNQPLDVTGLILPPGVEPPGQSSGGPLPRTVPCSSCGGPIPVEGVEGSAEALDLPPGAPIRHAVCPEGEERPPRYFEVLILVFDHEEDPRDSWTIDPSAGAIAASRSVTEAHTFAGAAPKITAELSGSWDRVVASASLADRPVE